MMDSSPSRVKERRYVELHFFLERPTQRLDDSALDLVRDAVGVTMWPLSSAATALRTRIRPLRG